MIVRTSAALLLGLALVGCGVYREATSTTAPISSSWRRVTTDGDRNRIRNWRKIWDEALPRARAADPAAIAADPALFDPDRARADVALPAGDYRCRTYKLAASGTGIRDFAAYPWVTCRVSAQGDLLAFDIETGVQRPSGLLFRDSAARSIFLGTLVLGDETSPLRYGLDSTRDMAGYLDRIGDRRWRLVLPHPRFESLLDITEIVPAG